MPHSLPALLLLLLAPLLTLGQPGIPYSLENPTFGYYLHDYTESLSSHQRDQLNGLLKEFADRNPQMEWVVILSDGNTWKGEARYEAERIWAARSQKLDSLRKPLILWIKLSSGEVHVAKGESFADYLSEPTVNGLIEQIWLPAYQQRQYYQGVDRLTRALMGQVEGIFRKPEQPKPLTPEERQMLEEREWELQEEYENALFWQSIKILLLFYSPLIVLALLGWYISYSRNYAPSSDTEEYEWPEDQEDMVSLRTGSTKMIMLVIVSSVVFIVLPIPFLPSPQAVLMTAPFLFLGAQSVFYALLFYYYAWVDWKAIKKARQPQKVGLGQLSPAEALMLLHQGDMAGEELFYTTLQDLIFRRVLQVYEVWRKPHPRDRDEKRYLLINLGEHADRYSYKPHEAIFLQAEFPDQDHALYLTQYVQTVMKQLEGLTEYRHLYVGEELAKKGLFNTRAWAFGRYELTDIGQESLKMVQSQYEQLHHLDTHLQNDPAFGMLLIEQTGTNLQLAHEPEEIAEVGEWLRKVPEGKALLTSPTIPTGYQAPPEANSFLQRYDFQLFPEENGLRFKDLTNIVRFVYNKNFKKIDVNVLNEWWEE